MHVSIKAIQTNKQGERRATALAAAILMGCAAGAPEAGFAQTFTVTPTVQSDTGGTIAPDTPQLVATGSTVSFAATPDPGWVLFPNLFGSCGGSISANTITTNPVIADCGVHILFQHPQVSLRTYEDASTFVDSIPPLIVAGGGVAGSARVWISNGWGGVLEYSTFFVPSNEGCESPNHLPWISMSPATGTLTRDDAAVPSTITADASSLSIGTYATNLCIASNDPEEPFTSLPVTVYAREMRCSLTDNIFCHDFEESPQLVVDPGFEKSSYFFATFNTPYWAADEGGFLVGSEASVPAYEGDYLARGGGYGEPSTNSWSQSVQIANGGPRFLNFWRFIEALPASDGEATFTVSIDGTQIWSLDVLQAGLDADWVPQSVDLGAYADNRAHELLLQYATTSSNDGTFYFDYVTIDQAAASVPN